MRSITDRDFHSSRLLNSHALRRPDGRTRHPGSCCINAVHFTSRSDKMMSRSIGKATGGLLLGLSVAAAANAAPLFEPVTVLSRASATSETALGRLLATPSTAAVQEVRVDAA